ncbi:hypothetical protein PoB_003028200 [Plakobranchus ocellatus]|uniref:Uncharacterized protein n=1 Tax=Plakobranchus ocellatus TaxID=259542 RepID=A0AAV4AA66_9GAST|nr:hypothetical protein PoB_003028200 [Plakobranchus ocellatus]
MPVHNKISGFQALRQAKAPVAGLKLAKEGSLQILGWTHWPLSHRTTDAPCEEEGWETTDLLALNMGLGCSYQKKDHHSRMKDLGFYSTISTATRDFLVPASRA